MSSPSSPQLSRRSVLLAGVAGVSSIPLSQSGWASTSAASTAALPLVKPVASKTAYEAFGVCSHPHFGHTGYQYTAEWIAALDTLGASYFRGMYDHDLAATRTTTTLARQHGLKWGMTVCPRLHFPNRELVQRIRHIARHAADICLYIEGINEPNHTRDDSPVPTDWAERAVAKQKVIWQTVKDEPRLKHVKLISPSLHSVASSPQDYLKLRNQGILHYIEYAGLHRYPGGRYPDHLLDQRLSWIRQYWGRKPVWITETGYTNALHRKRGHKPVPEDVSAVYAPSALLEAIDRNCNVCWYELLDDPDPLAQDTESNFGMYATAVDKAPPWRAKPVIAVMRVFLDSLKDPGPDYDPPAIRLRVTTSATDVRTTLVAKRDGTAMLHVRRATSCWDAKTRQPVVVTPVAVVVETAKGRVTLTVDHKVQSIVV